MDFDAASDFVDKITVPAAAGIPLNLMRLIKVHYTPTKARFRASGGDYMSVEICLTVRQGCAFSITLFIYAFG